MHSLHKLLTGMPGLIEAPAEDVLITGLSADSRAIEPGHLFVAWTGHTADGHAFIPEAIERGASTILLERPPAQPLSVPIIRVTNARLAYSHLCSAWFDHPASRLTIVGITGTNGKSSSAYFLYQLWQALGYKTGLIGTVFCKADTATLPATLTTPDSYKLHELLAHFLEREISHVVMEVSSIALDQYRTDAIPFRGAVFTNLSHDHLDYHKTFTAYRNAKKRLFDGLDSGAFSLTNIDDRNGLFMLQNTPSQRYSYSLRQPADFQGTLVEAGMWGLSFRLRLGPLPGPTGLSPLAEALPVIHSPLIGHFQVENLLAAWGAALLVERPAYEPKAWGELAHLLAQKLSQVQGLPGRMEPIALSQHRLGIVDYAHTPDAVEKSLRVLRSLLPPGGQLIAVLGAGGNRDRSKRPAMSQAAACQADIIWLTSDNPRYESPEAILEDLYRPLPPHLRQKVFKEPDRREAIHKAIAMAPPHSIIAVLGKGHETYQEIQGFRHPFSDQAVLLEMS